jgi:hypothetical protein
MYKEVQNLTPAELKKIILWVMAWMSITTFSNLVLIGNGYTYSKNPLIISLYFLFFSAIGFYYWNLKKKPSHFAHYIKQSVLIIGLFILAILFCFFIKELFPLNAEVMAKIPENKFELPQFSNNFMISKLAEIIFQQIYILALLQSLKKHSDKDLKTIRVFTVFFTLIHIPLLVILGWQAFYFIIPSFFAGFIFSYLLLKYRYGLVYSFALHIGFYLALGTYLRLTI